MDYHTLGYGTAFLLADVQAVNPRKKYMRISQETLRIASWQRPGVSFLSNPETGANQLQCLALLE